MDALYSIIVTGSSAGPPSSSGTTDCSPGTNASMSVMCPIRVAFHRGATRIPVDMASIEPVDRMKECGIGAVELHPVFGKNVLSPNA